MLSARQQADYDARLQVAANAYRELGCASDVGPAIGVASSTARALVAEARKRGMLEDQPPAQAEKPRIRVPAGSRGTGPQAPPAKKQPYIPAPAYSTGAALPVYLSRPDNSYVFGALGDTHLGSKYCRLDALADIYDRFERAKVDRVFHTGNWIDGEARFNTHDLVVRGMDAQCRYLAKEYPRKPGIINYAVAGDDHEGWYCFEPGVEILTKSRGWVDLSAIDGTEQVATKNPATGEFEWQKPCAVIRKRHNGKMIRFRHRSIDVAVTPEHRFEVLQKPSMHGAPRRVVMTASEILESFKPRTIGIPRSTDFWGGSVGRFVAIPRVPCRYNEFPGSWRPEMLDARDLALLCAWYATEGWTDGHRVNIGQSEAVNAENHEIIACLIRRLGATPKPNKKAVGFSSPDVAEYLRENCGVGWQSKRLPDWVLDAPADVLVGVFDAMIRADGHNRGAGKGWKFYSGSAKLLAQMDEVCQKIGLASSSTNGNGCTNISISEKHQVAYLFERPSVHQYDGDVFCVAVKNERIFVRRNGKTFWSMNSQREGVDIGKYAESAMRAAGRNDWVDLGYMEAHVILRNVNTGAECILAVVHPGGGSAYADSYAIQKIVEILDGGEKPAVALYGHYHKLMTGEYRNVWYAQTGCFQSATPFARKKKLRFAVGGLIIRLEQDPETGAISTFAPTMIRYFNRGYYNGRWSMSGDVTHPPLETADGRLIIPT